MSAPTIADSTRKGNVGDRMIKVMRMRGLTAQERLVLAAIAYHDGRGTAHPTTATIGDMAGGITPRMVRHHTAALAQKGVLSKRRGQRGNVHEIEYEWNAVKFLTGNAVTALKQRTREFQSGNAVSAHSARAEMPFPPNLYHKNKLNMRPR